ncbi:MAG: hypothetical protein KDA52_14555 [Planctomycetaceae bacterium]|nr:hypothetical protein [Planctomycetaceae bacterium]
MKPTGPSDMRLLDLFRASLRQFLNPAHPLLSLAAKIDGTRFDESLLEKWGENPYWHACCGFDTVLSSAA